MRWKYFLFFGGNICRCYDYDKDLRALLLEAIRPGNNLLAEDNPAKWLKVGAEFSGDLPTKPGSDSSFPFYRGWLDKAFVRAKDEGKVGENILNYIARAEGLFIEMERGDEKQIFLHGDLHNRNILRSKEEGWKAIDSKGVVGFSVLESARFLDNQLSITESIGDFFALEEMIEVFADKLEKEKNTIASSLYILLVLSACWSNEAHSPKASSLRERIDKCRFVDRYLDYF